MPDTSDFQLPRATATRLRPDRWGLHPATIVVLVVLLAGFAALGWVKLGAPAHPAPAAGSVPGSAAGVQGQSGDLESPTLVIYVSGQVAAPGVYDLAPGARVHEAITAAGGPEPEADLSTINLARPLVDGEQINVIASGGQETPSSVGAPIGALPTCVDINQADGVALEQLPGIGPALAQRILAHRSEIGSFPSKEALQEVSGIGPKVYAGLQDDLCG